MTGYGKEHKIFKIMTVEKQIKFKREKNSIKELKLEISNICLHLNYWQNEELLSFTQMPPRVKSLWWQTMKKEHKIFRIMTVKKQKNKN